MSSLLGFSFVSSSRRLNFKLPDASRVLWQSSPFSRSRSREQFPGTSVFQGSLSSKFFTESFRRSKQILTPNWHNHLIMQRPHTPSAISTCRIRRTAYFVPQLSSQRRAGELRRSGSDVSDQDGLIFRLFPLANRVVRLWRVGLFPRRNA